jgi:adenylate kinase family enzyme
MHDIHNTHDSQALKNKVLSADVAKTGFLLDGYPRTVEQAKLLKQHGVPIDKIVLVDPSQQATRARTQSWRQRCRSSCFLCSGAARSGPQYDGSSGA